MPEVSARSGADFVKGDGTGIRVREDGALELANTNDLPNSDLKDFSAGSITPDHVAIHRPMRPVGWGVYLRSLASSATKTMRQNLRMLDMNKDDYYQVGPLTDGPPPPDPTTLASIPPPTIPRVSAEPSGQTGMIGGWSAWSYGWIVARAGRNPVCEVMESPLLTAPAPRTTINLSSGQCSLITLPETAPQGAVGIYLCGNIGKSTSSSADSSAMQIIRRLDITSSMGRTYLVDRFSGLAPAPTTNQTWVGGFEQWPPPRRQYVRKGVKGMRAFTTKLCYVFNTQHGWSKPQGTTGSINTASVEGTGQRLAWRPDSVPSNATLWQPLFLGDDGVRWWFKAPRPLDTWAYLRTTDPEDFHSEDGTPGVWRETPRDDDPQRPDKTGLPDPAVPFPGVAVQGRPELPPGNYRAHVVFFDETGRETALSPPKDVTVALNTRVRIERPKYGNWLVNPLGYAIDASTGTPRGWTLFPANAPTLRVDPPLYFTQTSGATEVKIAELPLSPIHQSAAQGSRNTTLRVLWRFTRYVSGHTRLGVRFYNDQGSEQGVEQMFPTNAGALGDVDLTYSMAKAGQGAQITIPDAATQYKLTIWARGTVSARNYDVKVVGIGAFPGSVAPRTLPEGFAGTATVAAVEGDADTYAHGAYAVVEEDPVDRPAALAGHTMNSFRYFAPLGTAVSSFNGIRGWLHPCRASEQRTASVYTRWEGPQVAMPNILPIISVDKYGRPLQNHGPLFSISANTSSAWARKTKTYTTHPDAAYVYFAVGNLADGEILMMGFQDQDGSAVSAYSNTGVASGDWTVTLDCGIPGVSEASIQDYLNMIHRFELAGAVYTDDTDDDSQSATTVTVSFRSSSTRDPYLWSNFYTNIDDVPKLRYWQVKVALATSDVTRSPVVDWMGIQFTRPYGVLLRSDGTEYEGGCVVQSMPPIPARRRRQEFETDSNDWVLSFSGNTRRSIDDVTLLCFTRETAEEIMEDQDSGNGFVLESYPKRARAMFWPSNISFKEMDDGRAYDEEAPQYYWQDHEASGVSGHVSQVQAIPSE